MISKNAVLAFLLVSAAVLGCVLVLQQVLPGRAWAAESSRGGDYVAATATLNGSSDALWLVNVRTGVLSAYSLTNTGQIGQLGTIDLKLVFLGPRPAAGGQWGTGVSPLPPGGSAPGSGEFRPTEETPAPAGPSRPGRPGGLR